MRLLKIHHGCRISVDDTDALHAAEFKSRQFHAPPGSESNTALLTLKRFGSSARKGPFCDVLVAGGLCCHGQEFLTMRSVHVDKKCFLALVDFKEGKAIASRCWQQNV